MDFVPERGAERFRFKVPGQAAGAGSKKAFPVTRGDGSFVYTKGGVLLLNYTHDSKKTAPWMKAVKQVAKTGWGDRAPLDGPLYVDLWFYEMRPAGDYLKRKAGRVLRPDAPAYPDQTQTHDYDKMRRAISDSLTQAGVIADDRRVVGGEGWKLFADNFNLAEPFTVVIVGSMNFTTVEEAGLVTPDPAGQAALV
jgi:Holliday junction resolvase RusA-like endonuclease